VVNLPSTRILRAFMFHDKLVFFLNGTGDIPKPSRDHLPLLPDTLW